MSASAPFRITADVLEQLETAGATVRAVTAGDDGLYDREAFGTDVRAELPVLEGFDLPERFSVTVSDASVVDGRLRFTVSLSTAAEPAYRDAEALREVYEAHDTFPAMTEALGADVEPQTVRKHMVRAGIHDPERSGRPGATVATGRDAEEEASVDNEQNDADAHETTREVETDETTAGLDERNDGPDETADELDETTDGTGVDEVTDGGEKARPDPGRDVPDAEPGAPIDGHIAADGLGLPEGVTLAELRAALEGSRTLHEVQRHTGAEREALKRCLGNLGLLDLVVGRVSESAGAITAEEIDRRIARATA